MTGRAALTAATDVLATATDVPAVAGSAAVLREVAGRAARLHAQTAKTWNTGECYHPSPSQRQGTFTKMRQGFFGYF